MTLSIITICFNDRNGLEKTIQSARQQTFKHFEHIVIDGGSSDGSVEIIDKHRDYLAYSISEKDTGRYNAMNKGILKAKGEYCLFLNSGDYLASDEVLQTVFETPQTADLVYGDLYFDKGDKKELYQQPAEITFDYLLNATMAHPATFIKKYLFDKYGLYNESYKIVADYDFFLKNIFYNNLSFKYICTPISVFNLDGISNNKSYTDLQITERTDCVNKHIPSIALCYIQNIEKKNREFENVMFEKAKQNKITQFLLKIVLKITWYLYNKK